MSDDWKVFEDREDIFDRSKQYPEFDRV